MKLLVDYTTRAGARLACGRPWRE